MSTDANQDLTLSLQGDSPLDDPLRDRLRRSDFAKRLADVIAKRESTESIIIGIHGAWGEGKTTTLNFMRKHLDEYPDVVVVSFNPWRYGDEDSLLRGFFMQLASAIEQKLTGVEEILTTIHAYSDALASVPLLPGPLKDLGSLIAAVTKQQSTVDLMELRNRLDDALAFSGKRVVVLVDDIDRLEKAEVQAVFRLVKLCADFSRTAYVLAFDRSMVAAAVGEQYGLGDSEAGERFLEKIIQVPLHLPPASVDVLTRLWWEHLQMIGVSLESEEAREYTRLFTEGLSPALRTVRVIKRYANAVAFALPLVKGEVNTVDLLLLEGLRVLFPCLYDHIRTNLDAYLCQRDWLLGISAETKAAREIIRQRAIDQVPELQKRAAQKLVGSLFPQTVMASVAGVSETWDREKRVCSAYYADRYFTYGISEGDIPDDMVLTLMGKAEMASPSDLSLQLTRLLATGSAEALLRKLGYYIGDIEGRAARNLALGMSPLMEHLSDQVHPFLEAAPALTAGAMIAQLCGGVAADERYEVARQVVIDICPLHRADIVAYFLCRSRRSGTDRVLSDGDRDMLRSAFAERIGREVKSGQAILMDLREGGSLFAVWAEVYPAEVAEYLTSLFDEHPEESIRFVSLFCPVVLDSQGTHRAEFEAEHYQRLKRVADPELVRDALERHFGAQLSSEKHRPLVPGESPSPLDLAKQFIYIHHHGGETQS